MGFNPAEDPPPPGLLSRAEAQRYERLVTPRRRRSWLLGRLATKRLLQTVHYRRSGQLLPLEGLLIGNYASGEPFAVCLGADRPAGLTISLSHSGNWAVCAAVERPAVPLGIDLERVEPRSAGFVADYFTAAEQATVRSAPAARRDLLVTAIWSAKEAALKALHLGLKVDTRSLSCRPAGFDEETGDLTWRPVAIHLDPGRLGAGLPALAGWWRRFGPFVLLVVAAAGLEIAPDMVRPLAPDFLSEAVCFCGIPENQEEIQE